MIVGQIPKRPGEEFPLTEDFSGDLAPGERVASVEMAAIDLSTMAAITSGVLVGIHAIDDTGTQVSQMVKNGDHGLHYLVRFTATTDSTPPAVYVHEIEVMVSEGA